LVVVLLCLGAAVYAFWPAPPAQQALTIGGDFELRHETGAMVRTAEAFAGQPMLVYFGYTFCPDVCPTTLLDMVVASEMTTVDVSLVFVSVDPARDGPEELSAYTDLFTQALHGFTGSAATLEAVKEQWAIYSARHETEEFSEYLVDHTTLIFLTDRNHQVVEVFKNGTKPEIIAEAINARWP